MVDEQRFDSLPRTKRLTIQDCTGLARSLSIFPSNQHPNEANMSNDKKVTVKSWLRKASGKVSAEAFIAASREFLQTGELAPLTTPILAQVDSKALLPTPALENLQSVILSHYLAVELRKAEDKIAASAERADNAIKNWMVTIFDSKGVIQTRVNDKGETVELQESFELASTADNWADRRLFLDCTSDCHAIVAHTALPIETRVERGDAIARILKPTKGPVSKKMGSRDGKLSFGVKAIQSRASFSRG